MKDLDFQSIQDIDVVGIGNAIVDVLVKTDDSFLQDHSLIKGSMTLLKEDQAKKLCSEIHFEEQTSGGSVSNSLAGIAQLGGKAAFIGRVRNDSLGEVFTKEMSAAGTIFKTPPAVEGPSTARCLIFITPDAQRTMCTYLGASVLIEPEDLDLSIIKKTKVLYLEGYLWDNSAAKNAFIAAASAAKGLNKEVALSLSDSFCVERHRESFIELVSNHIDILFANEEEIKSLYQTSDLDKALNQISKNCKTAAITLGNKGSIILNEKERININPYKIGNLTDTTGAGDLYAGGFLFGYTHGETLERCGQIGSICAGHIVSKIGSRATDSLKEIVEFYL